MKRGLELLKIRSEVGERSGAKPSPPGDGGNRVEFAETDDSSGK